MASVLVLEDDDDNRELLLIYLSDCGYRVTSACDGQEGLECHPENFDVIVLDLRMPRVDGVMFKRELDRRKINTPVVVVSGEHGGEILAAEISAAAFLVKPVDLEKLRGIVAWSCGSCVPPAAADPTPAPIKHAG